MDEPVDRRESGAVSDLRDPRTILKTYLQSSREALVWKLDGLSEREARRPRTPTGTSLAGLVKHCLNVEAAYFGPTFGRACPMEDDLVPMDAYDTDPQADWYATSDETAAGLVDLYRRVWAFADETIDELPLEATGRVPWWPAERAEVTLQRVVVHVHDDVARHAGHADILREQIDGATGLRVDNTNVPDGYDWPAYVARLEELAASADR
jgi:uncharacterized damage-inducible protein DinB